LHTKHKETGFHVRTWERFSVSEMALGKVRKALSTCREDKQRRLLVEYGAMLEVSMQAATNLQNLIVAFEI
jgi:hypothetical protein